MNNILLKVSNLTSKVTLNNGEKLITVNNVSFEIIKGESYAIVGKSGSGKTSLISILGLLNLSFDGEYYYKRLSVKDLKDNKISKFRSKKIGFVFQNYSLIKHLKIGENIELPLFYSHSKMNKKERKERIYEVLKKVELEHRINDYPNNLSGGEQQRVAIARALVSSPEILICDEPTGALDKNTGELVMNILFEIVKQENMTLILVTHEQELANKCNVIMQMDEGKIIK